MASLGLQALTPASSLKTTNAWPYHPCMNKFTRLLLTLGVVAAVLWLLRDKIVPPPQPPVAHPPAFRNQPQPAAVAPTEPQRAGDDMAEVKGIGPVYKDRLSEMGITTFAELAVADAAAISERLEVAGDQVDDWINQARERT
jgi:hypothetical protein